MAKDSCLHPNTPTLELSTIGSMTDITQLILNCKETMAKSERLKILTTIPQFKFWELTSQMSKNLLRKCPIYLFKINIMNEDKIFKLEKII